MILLREITRTDFNTPLFLFILNLCENIIILSTFTLWLRHFG